MSIAILLVAVLVAGACGDGNGGTRRTPTPTDIKESPTPVVETPTPAGPPTELRVAYVNLQSPIIVDENDMVAAETYEERLQILVDELRAFRPDLVGVSEATWTEETGQAWATLASGLGMEAQFVRSNPWYPGQDLAESDQTRDLVGFEEGEAVLSRFPILEGTRIALNPRTSESEGRAALRVTVLVPGVGEVDVYVARLSGDAGTRAQQAISLSLNVELSRGTSPRILMADLGVGPADISVQLFTAQRYYDAASAAEDGAALGTCCRSQVLVAGEPTGTPGLSPTIEPVETGTPTSEPEPAMSKTMYIFASSWRAVEFDLIADEPRLRPDGSQLYASDHNGIAAVLTLEGSDTAASPNP